MIRTQSDIGKPTVIAQPSPSGSHAREIAEKAARRMNPRSAVLEVE
jgi:hypothetical protein